MSVSDEWNVPGRPSHPDFEVLADLLSEGDALDYANLDRFLMSRGLHPKFTRDAALNDARSVVDEFAKRNIPVSAGGGPMAWVVGFSAGLRKSRGGRVPSVADLDAVDGNLVALTGVDEKSVLFVADQRTLRRNQMNASRDGLRQPEDAVEMLADLWLDGVVVGRGFDARRAELSARP